MHVFSCAFGVKVVFNIFGKVQIFLFSGEAVEAGKEYTNAPEHMLKAPGREFYTVYLQRPYFSSSLGITLSK